MHLLKAVAVGGDDDKVVAGKALKGAVGIVGVGSAKADVGKPFGDAFGNLFAVLTLNVEGDIGIFLTKGRDYLGQNVLRGNGGGAQGEVAFEFLL